MTLNFARFVPPPESPGLLKQSASKLSVSVSGNKQLERNKSQI